MNEQQKALAKIIRGARELKRDYPSIHTDAVLDYLAVALADCFAQGDPHGFCNSPDTCLVEPHKFDRDAFVAACNEKAPKANRGG